mmetsp:Transcript_51897/g.133804  ORF Transcript_51897/g.133804 Transcript_51897/m.133804 type:complete len:213 (+) Transcript_51897:308-946(+)
MRSGTGYSCTAASSIGSRRRGSLGHHCRRGRRRPHDTRQLCLDLLIARAPVGRLHLPRAHRRPWSSSSSSDCCTTSLARHCSSKRHCLLVLLLLHHVILRLGRLHLRSPLCLLCLHRLLLVLLRPYNSSLATHGGRRWHAERRSHALRHPRHARHAWLPHRRARQHARIARHRRWHLWRHRWGTHGGGLGCSAAAGRQLIILRVKEICQVSL